MALRVAEGFNLGMREASIPRARLTRVANIGPCLPTPSRLGNRVPLCELLDIRSGHILQSETHARRYSGDAPEDVAEFFGETLTIE